MKKNKKAFTLIELLAIIVILAIIAVITVPIILNIIENSKKGSAINSAYGFVDAINKKHLSSMIDGTNTTVNGTYTISDGKITGGIYTNEEIELSGTKPTSGSLTFENNKLQSGCIVINEYEVRYENGSFSSEGKGNCGTPVSPQQPTPNTPDSTPQEQIIQPEITLGISTSTTNSISIEFTITDSGTSGIKTTTCKTTSPSEITGTINNNTCVINGLIGNTTYTYQVSTETNSGGTDTKTGNKKTLDPLDGIQGTDGATYLKYDYIVYYNPVTNSTCTESDYKTDNSNLGYNGITNGGSTISATRTTQTSDQTGCLKWYLYSYKGTYANLLLDHNITGGTSSWGVEWVKESDFNSPPSNIGVSSTCTNFWDPVNRNTGYSLTCKGPLTALNFLKTQTSSWTTMAPKIPNSSSTNENSVQESFTGGYADDNATYYYTIDYSNYKARMLSYGEIVNIYQYIYGINNNSYPQRMYANATSDQINGAYWLDYAYEHSGANLFRTTPNGVFVASAVDGEYEYSGIRPVITVSKSSVIPE